MAAPVQQQRPRADAGPDGRTVGVSQQDEDRAYVRPFNRALVRFFGQAFRLCWRRPRLTPFVVRTLYRQAQASHLRLRAEEAGVHVPPLLILSVTRRCNLRCAGCYARAQHRVNEVPPAPGGPGAEGMAEMDGVRLRGLLTEARQLGVSIVLLAGGEPLLRPDLIDITRGFPQLVFPLFTNGQLLDEATARRLRRQPQVIPVLSLEGLAGQTDQRRGRGVHQRLQETMRLLQRERVLFGVSITVTRHNLALVTSGDFVRQLLTAGAGLFFFVDYVPVTAGTEPLALTASERQQEARAVEELRRRFAALFVAFPGDEEAYGGCLAAGRGFVHISAEGRVEPCPFSPFTDANLATQSLSQALASPLLRAIRAQAASLQEGVGGCALWEHRDWVASLTPGTGATGATGETGETGVHQPSVHEVDGPPRAADATS